MTLDVDAVVFDLDDTLCVYEQSVEEMLELSFERAGVEPFFDGPTYRAYFDEYFDQFDDIAALREHCFAEIAREQDRDPALGRAVAAEYEAARDPAGVRPRQGAVETVERLGEHYPLGVITNGGATLQGEKLERIGLADAFDAIVYAGDETEAKPEPEPFESILGTLGVTPERTVHVGNSLRSDVAGADAMGLWSVWTPTDPDLPEDVDDPGSVAADHPALDPVPDHVLAGVHELPPLLDGTE